MSILGSQIDKTPEKILSAKVLNCTPHAVSIFVGAQYDPSSGSCVGGKKLISFPASSTVATAVSSINPEPSIILDGTEIPVISREFCRVTHLPEGYDIYLVSSLYAQAVAALGKDTSKLMVPYGSVVNEHGKQIGCTGLVRAS